VYFFNFILAKLFASILPFPYVPRPMILAENSFFVSLNFFVVSFLDVCGTKLLYRSFYTGINIRKVLDSNTLGEELVMTGVPEGSRINYCCW